MSSDAAEKLLKKMRSSASGWGQSDFDRLFKGFGFVVKEGKKHRIYRHPVHSKLWISIPRHNNLRDWVTRDSVSLLDDLMNAENKEGDNK